MNPEIIEKELLVIGLETTSREGPVADDVHAQGELAEDLPATVPNQIDMTHPFVVEFNPKTISYDDRRRCNGG